MTDPKPFSSDTLQDRFELLQSVVERLDAENRKLREALQYIVDHNWVAGATPVKWINEFADVAKSALQ